MAEDGETPIATFRKSIDGMGDKVRETAAKSFEGTKLWIKEKNPALGEKIDEAEQVVLTYRGEFEKKGFCENYKDYNKLLLSTPMSMTMERMKASLSMKPEDPKTAFITWNVMCFWLGVVDLILVGLLTVGLVLGALGMAALDCFLGYVVAYFFYFVFICSENKKLMQFGFIALAAYVVITLYLAYTSFMGLQFLEVGLNVFKAVFNSIVSFHAFQLYRATPAAELV